MKKIIDVVTTYIKNVPHYFKSLFTSRQFKFGGNSFIVTILFAGIIVVVNLMARDAGLRWDLTKNKIYSLSAESIKVVKELKSPVKVYVFYPESTEFEGSRREVKKTLDEYKTRNKNFTYELVDPYKNRGLTQQYGVNRVGTLILVSGDKKETIVSSTETEITSALIKLENPQKIIVTFWSGLGERDIDKTTDEGYSEFKTTLERLNFVVNKQDTNKDTAIPSDTNILVIASPQNFYTQKHSESLEAYLKRGGTLLLLADTNKDNRKIGIESVLEKYGISLKYGHVIDPVYRNPFALVFEEYPSFQITEGLPPTAFLDAIEVKPTGSIPEHAEVTKLLETSPQSWLESGVIGFEQPTLDTKSGDAQGPINLGVAMRFQAPEDKKSAPEYKTRIVAIGDSDLASNLITEVTSTKEIVFPGNLDLVVNSLNWLVSRDNLINVVPKDRSTSTFTITPNQQESITILVLYVMPGAALLAAAVVWRMRSRKKKS